MGVVGLESPGAARVSATDVSATDVSATDVSATDGTGLLDGMRLVKTSGNSVL